MGRGNSCIYVLKVFIMAYPNLFKFLNLNLSFIRKIYGICFMTNIFCRATLFLSPQYIQQAQLGLTPPS
jgi:hypothetical protein